MGKLSELLRWKRTIKLVNPTDASIVEIVYMRIIGDYDLQESYKLARLASEQKRARLRDVDSDDFKDQIASFKDATEEECKALIQAARESAWTSQALSAVVRPDEVKLSEIAVDPDAPTLEEQEKLDAANREVDAKYQQDLQDFVEQKRKELQGELAQLSVEQLRTLSQAEAIVLLPLTTYFNTLTVEKTWRSVYVDEAMTERGFDSADDFMQMLEPLRNQLLEAYSELEEAAGDIKN